MNRTFTIALFLLTLITLPLRAQEWSGPVRGSWVQTGPVTDQDVPLVAADSRCAIVVSPDAHTAILHAAKDLSGDIARITGFRPPIVTDPSGSGPKIRIVVLDHEDVPVPAGIRKADLLGKWESYQILTVGDDVWLVGSNFRGAVFAIYTLCERIGIDPLYIWTGYVPEQRNTLTLKYTDVLTGPPTFKYRGLFFNDLDIQPRPYDDNGYPLWTGTVPMVWYERNFETALRLRLNQVAPYTREQQYFEVQKTASDWGLFYTSHHFDILLSNPFGYERFGLAAARDAGLIRPAQRLAEHIYLPLEPTPRNADDSWNWFTNREKMLRYWRGGVLENRELNCIWPVGLRGTVDRSYPFPKDMSLEERGKVFTEVMQAQVDMVKRLLPPDKTPIFHFTLYREMLRYYQQHQFDIPADVIVVWPNTDADGHMGALPTELGKWKHGIYYHLACRGGPTKQSAHTVTPMLIEHEFRKVVDAGATEYMLLNVSELREFVMGTRFIADICWDADAAFQAPNAAGRYVDWWCREYFGEPAAADAVQAYHQYYHLVDSHRRVWEGTSRVMQALELLVTKFAGEKPKPIEAETIAQLRERVARYADAMKIVERAAHQMTPQARQFFFENCALGMLMEYRPTQAAIPLFEAVNESDLDKAWALCQSARAPLEQFTQEVLWAERPPFQEWYRATWIRPHGNKLNVNEAYEELRTFLTTQGRQRLFFDGDRLLRTQ